MNAGKLKAAAIVFGAMLMALYLGVSVATDKTGAVVWVVGGVTGLVCLLLGHRIWMLIPLTASMSFTLALPGSPSAIQAAQILVIGFSVLLFLMRRLPFRLHFGEIEAWCFVMLLCVVQVYLRNPVGLNVLGADSVGARPYMVFALMVVTALLFLGLKATPQELGKIFPLTVAGGLLGLGLSVFGYFVPSIGAYYGAVQVTGDRQIVRGSGEAATRVGFLGSFARGLCLWISARISPLNGVFRPFWAVLILISFAAAGASGFRNVIGWVGLIYIVGILYHGGGIQFIISVIGASVAILGVVIVNSIAPLPLNLQRAMSFLPGNWDSRVIQDASTSTDWRVEMWKEALLTDKWIENKILGDGLGMSRREIQWITSIQGSNLNRKAIGSDLTVQQEIMMSSGDYHSGPVHVVRVVGYAGLILALVAMVRIAVHAHRQIRRAWGTEWQSLALLVGLPAIVSPIFFVFVFGSFLGAMGIVLTGGSLVRLLENNLPLPAFVKARRTPYVLQRNQIPQR